MEHQWVSGVLGQSWHTASRPDRPFYVTEPTITLWFWMVPDERRPGKMRKTTYRMTEQDARQRHGGAAVKLEDTREERAHTTGHFKPY